MLFSGGDNHSLMSIRMLTLAVHEANTISPNLNQGM